MNLCLESNSRKFTFSQLDPFRDYSDHSWEENQILREITSCIERTLTIKSDELLFTALSVLGRCNKPVYVLQNGRFIGALENLEKNFPYLLLYSMCEPIEFNFHTHIDKLGLINKKYPRINTAMNLKQILRTFKKSHQRELPIVEGNESFLGILNLDRLFEKINSMQMAS